MATESYAGQTHGRWLILEDLPVEQGKDRRVLCQCTCGHKEEVLLNNIKRGSSQGCKGCQYAQRRVNAVPVAIYKIHWGMVDRCYNEQSKDYPQYGGRGIGVCSTWTEDVKQFYADVGERPSDKHTLDRIDNDKDYGPNNCRWATPKEQANNRRTNRLLTHKGKTQSLTAWAETKRIPENTLRSRLRKGWPVDKALTQPVRFKTK